MRAVNITTMRQDATQLIDEVGQTHQPILIIQRSRPAAYVVAAADYEAEQQELRELRRQVFWQEVEAGREENRRGETPRYDSADELIADLGLEE